MAYTISSSLIPTTAAYVADDTSLKGGYRTVQNVTDRDSIIFTRLKQGMLVYTADDDKVWKLSNLVINPEDPMNNTLTWDEFGASSANYTLPIATDTVLGGIKVGTGLSIDIDGILSNDYTLPTATDTILGGVKIDGTTITIADGVISAVNTGGGTNYTLPIATDTTLGGIKVGTGLSIDIDGILSNNYTLPIASDTILGGIKIGTGLSIDAEGIVSVTSTGGSNYTLPIASDTTLGGVKVGTGLSIDAEGILSNNYTLPTASTSVLGGVKIDGNTITIADGVISINPDLLAGGPGVSYIFSTGLTNTNNTVTLNPATPTELGGIKVGTDLSIDGESVVNLATQPELVPGVYGSSSEIPVITVNSKGVITKLDKVPNDKPLPAHIDYVYDDNDNIVQITTVMVDTKIMKEFFTYDDNDNVTLAVEEFNHVRTSTTFEYDINDNVISSDITRTSI